MKSRSVTRPRRLVPMISSGSSSTNTRLTRPRTQSRMSGATLTRRATVGTVVRMRFPEHTAWLAAEVRMRRPAEPLAADEQERVHAQVGELLFAVQRLLAEDKEAAERPLVAREVVCGVQ